MASLHGVHGVTDPVQGLFFLKEIFFHCFLDVWGFSLFWLLVEALNDFYTATGGSGWLVSTGWNSKNDPCQTGTSIFIFLLSLT